MNAAISPTQQPIGGPVVRGDALIQVLATITEVGGDSGDVTVTSAQITDATTVGKSVLTATNAAAARTAIGAGTSSLVIGTTASTAMAGDKFTQGSAVPNVGSQTVSGEDAASVATSATTAVNAVATKLNDLLTQLRASGIIASS